MREGAQDCLSTDGGVETMLDMYNYLTLSVLRMRGGPSSARLARRAVVSGQAMDQIVVHPQRALLLWYEAGHQQALDVRSSAVAESEQCVTLGGRAREILPLQVSQRSAAHRILDERSSRHLAGFLAAEAPRPQMMQSVIFAVRVQRETIDATIRLNSRHVAASAVAPAASVLRTP